MKKAAPLELVKLAGRRGMRDETFERVMELLAERRDCVSAGDDLPGDCAETVAESLFAGNDSPAPDCRECGACCSYFHRVPVQMTDPTPRALTWKVWEAGAASGPRLLWLRREPESGRCVALSGRVGESATCAIYELRPNSCRAFEAGSDRCHAVRRLHGLEPQLSEPERIRRIRVLGGRGEERFEEAAPVVSDEAGRVKFLRELIEFSREKLDDILAESKRLRGLFDERGIEQGATLCSHVMKAIEEDSKAVAEEQARISVTANVESEEFMKDLLGLGITSHEALERASARLADLGRFAFEATGMRLRLEESARLHAVLPDR